MIRPAYILATAVLFCAAPVLAGPNILTGHMTCGPTPAIIGESSGRGLLEITIDPDETNGAFVGPMDLPIDTWWQIVPAGFPKKFGILYRGQYTGQKVIGCVSEPGAEILFSEEGGMPDRTSTITATPTVTDTPTRTHTFTPTPVDTDTPTRTPTITRTPTRTATPVDTSTQTATPVDTSTPTETP